MLEKVKSSGEKENLEENYRQFFDFHIVERRGADNHLQAPSIGRNFRDLLMKTIDKTVMALGNEPVWNIFKKIHFRASKFGLDGIFLVPASSSTKKRTLSNKSSFDCTRSSSRPGVPTTMSTYVDKGKKDEPNDFMKLKVIRFHYY